MHARKLEHLLSSQSSIAAKVYEFVPLKEAWTVNQIVAEMNRQGQNPNFPVVHGCLNSLVKGGLLKEVHGLFSRVRVSVCQPGEVITLAEAKARQNDQDIYDMKPTLANPTKPDEPVSLAASLDKLFELSAGLRTIANQVDDAILEVQQALDQKEADFKKAKAAIQALRDLGL